MTETFCLKVNGREHRVEAEPKTALLYILRNDLSLNGPKFGCGLGECGACSILVDGRAARACSIPLSAVRQREITTLEGLSVDGKLHVVQQAFIEESAAQCGYCLNGMIISIVSLLKRKPDADEAEMREALRHNLCRCGTHMEILAAARRAVELGKIERAEVSDDAAPPQEDR